MQSFDTDPVDAETLGSESQTIPVCAVSDLPPSACRRVLLPNGDELAIVNVDGEYYAIDNLCPHRGAPLSDGIIRGTTIECGLHGWEFDLRSGECLTVTEKLRTYRVRVEGSDLVVEW
jgi:3-phenylpropionate/trans-cinnamate dioxygenase ferredoxin component